MTLKSIATTFAIALVAVVAHDQYKARGGVRRGA